jgi:hypothetical protein
MATYLVIYDLISPGQNYTKIHEQIKTYKKWARPTESTWIVVTEKTSVQIRDHIKQYIDSNDRLIVVKSAGVGAWFNPRCSNSWLKENL